jgi:hypothetical protein
MLKYQGPMRTFLSNIQAPRAFPLPPSLKGGARHLSGATQTNQHLSASFLPPSLPDGFVLLTTRNRTIYFLVHQQEYETSL